MDYLSSSQKASERPGSQFILSKTQQPFQSVVGITSPSKTMMNTNQNMSSFDASGISPQIDQSQSSNLLWVNGVAYQSDKVNKEKIRRKSDMFLVRIMNSLCHKLGSLGPEEIIWCQEITKDLILLSKYISKVHSRIAIFQIIDTVMNPLIVMKKMLTDITLKDKRGFHTGTGMVQSPFINVESWRANTGAQKSPNFAKFKDASSNRKAEHKYDKAIREVFACYLNTLSSIFSKCKTQETYKMMSEIFIKDRSWQDAVQSFSLY